MPVLKRHITLFFVLLPLFSMAQLLPNLGGQRAGISTLTFLKNDISPRSMALSGTNITLTADGMATAHNPALMAQADKIHFAANDLVMGLDVHQAWISGMAPFGSNNNAIGLNLTYFSTGAMKVRTEFQPEGTGDYFYGNQWAAGVAYGKKLSDRFSFGTNFKLVRERLAQYTNTTVAVDLGFLYTTDVKDLKFGIVVQNFGGNSALTGDFLEIDFNRSVPTLDKYNVPTVFRLGASIRPIETDDHSLMCAIQLEHPNDNSENLRLGVEYDFREMLFLRAGYKLNVPGENLPTLGIGYRTRLGRHTIMVNYGVNHTRYLGTFHAFGLDLGISTESR